MSAAAQARRRMSRDELEIVAFELSEWTSYSACGLPYLVAGEVVDEHALVARSPEEHRARGIDVRLRHEVVAIDVDARTVTARNLDAGTDVVEPFDRLVIATGATPFRPPLPGADARGVHGIQTMADGLALRDHLARHPEQHRRAVVVGCGYVGLEMADAMRVREMDVTVIDRNQQPMTTLDPDMGKLVGAALRGLGIDVRTVTHVEGFETDDNGHVRAVATDQGPVPADIVVLGLGVRPNAALARDAGIAIGVTGGIATDDHMATSVEGVWAAGDCVETYHRVTGAPAYIALGTHANKQGRVVGINATGGDEMFGGVIGTSIVKVCAYEIARSGLTEIEAVAAGLDYVHATIESTTRAGYYPGAQPITVKMLAERESGRLLGAQIIGKEGAAKRIDVVATAIWAGLTVHDVVQLDLGYAPPLSSVWDPVLIAARQTAARLHV
jgi:NADPH-dependent 2,4-dienoyl-CoA reductase/sulfur reductase-like enzyme